MKNLKLTMEELNELVMDKVSKINDKVVTEFRDFQSEMLSHDSQYIFDNAFKISSYTDLRFYFENGVFDDFITSFFEDHCDDYEKYLPMLSEMLETNILDTLYNAQFDFEALYTTSWEDISTLVKFMYFYPLQ